MSVKSSYPQLLEPMWAQDATQVLPSGLSFSLYEVLIDEVGAEYWVRFRFLAPQIAQDTAALNFEDVQKDFEHLCALIAIPYLDDFDLAADVVVITLLDRPVVFGEADADATQLIEAFRVDGHDCRLEGLW